MQENVKMLFNKKIRNWRNALMESLLHVCPFVWIKKCQRNIFIKYLFVPKIPFKFAAIKRVSKRRFLSSVSVRLRLSSPKVHIMFHDFFFRDGREVLR